MKNGLVIFSSYFPPDTSVGTRRILSLIKFLSENNVPVTVVTPKRNAINPELREILLCCDVYETSIFKTKRIVVNGSIKEQVGKTNNLMSCLQIIMILVKRKFINPFWGQLFDPFLPKYISTLFSPDLKNLISRSVVLSSSPSWGAHLFAVIHGRTLKAPIILDYRDPFYQCHLFSTNFSKLEKILDVFFCKNANMVTVVSPSWVKLYSNLTDPNKVKLIRNGYDGSAVIPKRIPVMMSAGLSINYFGSISHRDRIPLKLLHALNELDFDISFNIYGRCDFIEIIKKNDKRNIVKFHGFISNRECNKLMRESDINYIQETDFSNDLARQGVIPTKVYEYIGACRPILSSVSRTGDSYTLLSQSGLLLANAISVNEFINFFQKIKLTEQNLHPNENKILSHSRLFSNKEFIKIIQSLQKR